MKFLDRFDQGGHQDSFVLAKEGQVHPLLVIQENCFDRFSEMSLFYEDI